MRASLLVVPLLLSCGGGSSTSGGSSDTKPKAAEVTGPGTRGFDEYPTEYGADEYGDFGYEGYDGYEDGYYGHGYGGEEYGGDWTPPPPLPPDLVGTWNGVCEPGTKDSKKLTFVISATRWDLSTEMYSDTTCTKRTSLIQTGGPYAMAEQSATVTGAWNAVFSFDVRDLTADDAKTAKAMGKLCGIKKLKAGAATSLLAKGCAKLGFKPLADCGGDFDLVSLTGSRVQFGVRPTDNDLCTDAKRPTALSTTHTFAYVWPASTTPECTTFYGALDTFVNCSKLPPGMGDMFGQFKSMVQYYTDATTCKAATDGVIQASSALGC